MRDVCQKAGKDLELVPPDQPAYHHQCRIEPAGRKAPSVSVIPSWREETMMIWHGTSNSSVSLVSNILPVYLSRKSVSPVLLVVLPATVTG